MFQIWPITIQLASICLRPCPDAFAHPTIDRRSVGVLADQTILKTSLGNWPQLLIGVSRVGSLNVMRTCITDAALICTGICADAKGLQKFRFCEGCVAVATAKTCITHDAHHEQGVPNLHHPALHAK
jgi:hypothetical protein